VIYVARLGLAAAARVIAPLPNFYFKPAMPSVLVWCQMPDLPSSMRAKWGTRRNRLAHPPPEGLKKAKLQHCMSDDGIPLIWRHLEAVITVSPDNI
jgi:hypothetical protein